MPFKQVFHRATRKSNALTEEDITIKQQMSSGAGLALENEVVCLRSSVA